MPLPVPLVTIDMLDNFPDDGNRYELLEGMLLVTPAPNNAHQVVATRLAHLLANALEPGAAAERITSRGGPPTSSSGGPSRSRAKS